MTGSKHSIFFLNEQYPEPRLCRSDLGLRSHLSGDDGGWEPQKCLAGQSDDQLLVWRHLWLLSRLAVDLQQMEPRQTKETVLLEFRENKLLVPSLLGLVPKLLELESNLLELVVCSGSDQSKMES